MAKKEAYYFSHDSNAQDDPKCMVLIDQMGMEGYGIFWALVERLRNEKDYKLPLCVCNAFAKRWGTSREKVETVIKNYGLFFVDEDFFYSKRLLDNMNDKSIKARESALIRWNNANGMRPHSDRNANGMRNDANKVKESKVKERKNAIGEKFSEKGDGVFFKDGSFQKFGKGQERSFRNGTLKPHFVKKGIIE